MKEFAVGTQYVIDGKVRKQKKTQSNVRFPILYESELRRIYHG